MRPRGYFAKRDFRHRAYGRYYAALAAASFRSMASAVWPTCAWVAVIVGVSLAAAGAGAQTKPEEDLYLRSSGEAWEPSGKPETRSGQDLYSDTCSVCHGALGEGLASFQAPRLSGLQPWYVERQTSNYQTGVRGADIRDVYGGLMFPFARALGDGAEIRRLADYIATLPDTPSRQTITGHVESGRRIYDKACAECHGPRGEGNERSNSPRLSGIDDWYLVTQLRNFQAGIRGYTEQDPFGRQMAVSIKDVLTDDASVLDVVAYINVLATPDPQEQLQSSGFRP